MIDPATLLGKVVEYLLAGALGWFVASFGFQRRLDDFEKRIVAPIRDRVAVFEGATTRFATREELKSEIASLRADFKEAVAELKSLIRELRTER
jgi:methyl-accepting chemotaxis protein